MKATVIATDKTTGEEKDRQEVFYGTTLDLVTYKSEWEDKYPNCEIEVDEHNESVESDEYLILGGEFKSWRQLSDGTFNIIMNAKSVTDDKVLMMRRINGQNGVFIFKSEGRIEKEDLDILKGTQLDTYAHKKKSQSQRVYNVLYRNWQLVDNGGFEKFEDYYTFKTEEIISHFKSKLPK